MSRPITTPVIQFCTHFGKDAKAIIQIRDGDHQQLRPLVFSRPKETPFKSQLQISLFTCVKLNGFMDVMFTDQHRMVGDLCNMVSNIFYASKLATAAILEDTVEQTFDMVSGYNHQVFSKGHPLIFINVSDAEDQRDSRQRSLINSKFAAVVYTLVDDLLHLTQITANQVTVLTPCRGQLHLYLSLFASNDMFQGIRQFQRNNPNSRVFVANSAFSKKIVGRSRPTRPLYGRPSMSVRLLFYI
jgi:superfamily I DNA and/or RNA helicase